MRRRCGGHARYESDKPNSQTHHVTILVKTAWLDTASEAVLNDPVLKGQTPIDRITTQVQELLKDHNGVELLPKVETTDFVQFRGKFNKAIEDKDGVRVLPVSYSLFSSDIETSALWDSLNVQGEFSSGAFVGDKAARHMIGANKLSITMHTDDPVQCRAKAAELPGTNFFYIHSQRSTDKGDGKGMGASHKVQITTRDIITPATLDLIKGITKPYGRRQHVFSVIPLPNTDHKNGGAVGFVGPPAECLEDTVAAQQAHKSKRLTDSDDNEGHAYILLKGPEAFKAVAKQFSKTFTPVGTMTDFRAPTRSGFIAIQLVQLLKDNIKEDVRSNPDGLTVEFREEDYLLLQVKTVKLRATG